jgi:hypothetical protein
MIINPNIVTSLSAAPEVQIFAILFLLSLLLEKEIIRVMGKAGAKTSMRALDIAILPLLIAFGIIIAERFVGLIF